MTVPVLEWAQQHVTDNEGYLWPVVRVSANEMTCLRCGETWSTPYCLRCGENHRSQREQNDSDRHMVPTVDYLQPGEYTLI